MFIDARTLSDGEAIEADICIIGAGAAGITLARELSGLPARVCLLESGGFDPHSRTQALYRAESAGLPVEPDESRIRMFGGSTNHWTGWCRPLDPIDFEKREWLPHSGWPFDKSHLDPFYERATKVLELPSARFDAASLQTDERPMLSLTDGIAADAIFQLSPPTRFGSVYREGIANARNVTAFVNASVVELVTCESGARVTSLLLRTLGGKRLSASASIYVLAAGGIENARLLLSSTTTQRCGLGNGHDLVGRFFMEHPYFYSAKLELSALAPSLALYAIPSTNPPSRSASSVGMFTFTERLQRAEQLVACVVRPVLHPDYAMRDEFFAAGPRSARRIADCVREWRMPLRPRAELANVVRGARDIGLVLARRLGESLTSRRRMVLRTAIEAAPDPDSRVTLSNERDSLGNRRARVDWRLGEASHRSGRRMHELLRSALARAGIGEISLFPDRDDTGWPASLSCGGHHSGTTRMHRSPMHGVVDENCRVHGVSNLFVAGSSVFPTIGYANPTLTIVALALRLADHFRTLRFPYI
jgi:choline dehydrogenase-like flavoprotein